MNEAETCRKMVRPNLEAAGWDDSPHSIGEQKSFTDGRIVVAGSKAIRREQRRADFLLRYRRDLTLAVVEAKKVSKPPGTGMQQAKDYADILGLKFAYATNGEEILEFDHFTGLERFLPAYPTPDELWTRFRAGMGLSEAQAQSLLTPTHLDPKKPLRYYQETAVNQAVRAISGGEDRCLLTMATGTGKTDVAFQICWKLWNARWNRKGEGHRRPKILFLADRTILAEDPMRKQFKPFGDARSKIENGEVVHGREMYFAIYQALAEDTNRAGLFRQFPPDFFDLIVVDECHRGSARDASNWRAILDYFGPAAQLGLTATPRHQENADTYAYFGEPLYTYSLRQGIDDGFLAPYRVHRVVTTVDAAGWRPDAGQVDRFNRPVPDEEYQTEDFERVVALRQRTRAIARHLTEFLKRTDRQAKTIVFCVDQEHADEMRRELNNLNQDITATNPNYVCRVTSDEGAIGLGHLSNFQNVEATDRSPVILTTSQMLTTGVDAPTVKNVVLARLVGSMTDFKQIIGRGTRVRDDYGKLYFNILDYTGTATRNFADPDFDGEPALATVQAIDTDGDTVAGSEEVEQAEEALPDDPASPTPDPATGVRRKFYIDGGTVEVVAHLVYELDADGKQLRVVQLKDYAAERVRTLFPNAAILRANWANPSERAGLIDRLEQAGVSFEELAEAAGQPDADPFDVLCHLAYNVPLRTRKERADQVRKNQPAFFDRYTLRARKILNDLLEKYAEHGTAQFLLPDVLEVPPLTEYGNVPEIAQEFGGTDRLREAVAELQTLLYEPQPATEGSD